MRSRLGNRILLLLIILITIFSFMTVWPSEPDRYLPNQIPWPIGGGIPLHLAGTHRVINIRVPALTGGTFKLKKITRRAMSLGLDLRGGTRLVLEPQPGFQIADIDAALSGAKDVIERRVNAFGVAESEVNRLGKDRIAVQLPGIKPKDAIEKIGRTALLEFCEPVTNSAGQVEVVTGNTGKVRYQAESCDPVRDASGNVVVDGGSTTFVSLSSGVDRSTIVWQPARATIDGQVLTLTGEYLKPTTRVTTDSLGVKILLIFEMNGKGSQILGAVTDRLQAVKFPLATFLDGEPITGDDGQIIAPTVQGQITQTGEITGLTSKDARNLSKLLNTGAFPVPLRVVQQQDVDATLGDTAVRDSVIAGEVALLIIMLFMIIYYRLPGVMASLALVVYTSVVLMIFKVWPVTLTLAGVAAFVLSLGMAVDANILIFERMKEELRIGRNLVSALEDGFTRAWSSIRDSNVSTLITCGILYWFGNQFNEAAIKGFAITLAIGVLVSLFSAITVTRTFMHLAISIKPFARRLWLFVPDLPEDVRRHAARRVPAMAGGSGPQPRTRSRSKEGR
jgi:preprotein translocase subunit SecD